VIHRALALILLATLAGAGPASAQPPIVRPPNERGLPSVELGGELFAANCASCHGSDGTGITAPAAERSTSDNTGQGPSLIGVGRQAPDFYLRTGYMPLERQGQQPQRRRTPFDEREIRALEDYVASLGPGPPVPTPHPASGNLSQGRDLFTEHCAGCHQAVAEGGVVTGARVPPLDKATPVQIAEAVRIGPYLMPKFSTKDISDAELDSLIAYVEYAKHPDDRGGWGIGHLGPFPEGMVTWLIASVVLVGFCMVIGERLRRS
jgi:ubiquinol-cytochrome c reductase cytochrome c subunit